MKVARGGCWLGLLSAREWGRGEAGLRVAGSRSIDFPMMIPFLGAPALDQTIESSSPVLLDFATDLLLDFVLTGLGEASERGPEAKT